MNRTFFKHLTLLLSLMVVAPLYAEDRPPYYSAVADQVDEKISNYEQLTNIPTIYITIPDININNIDNELKKGWFTSQNGTRYFDGTYFSAKIKVVDDAHPDLAFEDYVRIKVRGNSTSTPSKRSYRLKFEKTLEYTDESGTVTVSSQKHDLLGKNYKERSWTLLANVFDHSRIQNAINYHIGTYLGMPFCPGYRFVDLVINGKYRGNYQVCDHVNISENRVDINEDTDQMLEFVGWTNDMFYDLFRVNNSSVGWINIKNPDEEDVADPESYKAAIQTFITNWANASSADTYNDLETLAKFYLGTILSGDYDAALVAKVYRVADGPLCWGPLWDKDLAFGNSDLGAEDLVENSGNGTLRSFFNKLHTDATFLKKAQSIILAVDFDQLYGKLSSDIDALVSQIRQSWQLDYLLWGDAQVENYADKIYGLGSLEEYVDKIKSFLYKRIPFVKQTIKGWYDEVWAATAYTFDTSVTSYESWGSVAGKVLDLTMTNRTFSANVWNSITLPFNADETILKSVFGDDYDLREFSGVSDDGSTMLFKKPADNAIVARTPYVIKPSKNVDATPLFEGVIPVQPLISYTFINGNTVTYGNYSFTGSIIKEYILADGTHFLLGEDGITLSEPQKQNSYDTTVAIDGAYAYITVANGAQVPAISFVEEQIDQPVVRTQLTDVPTIYIDTQDGADIQSSAGNYVKAAIQVIDASGTLSEFTDLNDMEIRGKGAWDGVDKKSYRLKFAKKKKSSDGLEHKYDLTGGGYVKRNWVLLANGGDESLIRNALTKTLGDGVGLPFTPNFCFVDLVLNGEYVGSYLATDFIEADKNRVFAENEDTDWLLQMTGEDGIDPADLYIQGDENTPYITIKNPDSDDYTDDRKDELKNTVSTFFNQLWADNSGQYYDQTSLVNWYIAAEILGGYKAISDFYAYKAADAATLSFGPLWDNESSYDNKTSVADMTTLMADINTTGSYNGMAFNITEGAWAGKLAQLWQQTWFKTAVKTRWDAIKADLQTALTNQVAALKARVAQTHALNYNPEKTSWTTNTTLDDAARQVADYINARFTYLDAKFAELALQSFILGDVNGDGQVDIHDVTAIVRHICGTPSESFIKEAADLNGDESIDINDVAKLVKVILGTDAE